MFSLLFSLYQTVSNLDQPAKLYAPVTRTNPVK